MRGSESVMPFVHPEAIDQRPKPFSVARRIWAVVQPLLWLAWAWRWVFIVIVAVGWALSFLGFDVATKDVIHLGLAVVAAGSWWGWYRARLAAAVEATRVVAFRAYWPVLCSFCNFVELSGRRPRTATLISVTFGPGNWLLSDWVRVTVEPCISHLPATWDRYELFLRRHIRYRSSTWTTDPQDPNRIVITCHRRPLPTVVRVGTDIPTTAFLPTVGPETGGLKPADRVLFGVSASGGHIWWCPDEPGRAMLFVGGRQGGGKGEIAKRIFFYGLATNRVRRVGRWRMRVCDPKAMGEFNWLQPHGVTVSKDPAAMFAMIAAFRAEMDRRATILDQLGVENWLHVPADVLLAHEMDGREVLVIDEFVTLLTMKGLVPLLQPAQVKSRPKERPIDPYQVMIGDLQAVFAMGRASGMSLIPMTQHPIAEHMGPFGSTMKANLGARIGVGNLEPEGAGSMFGKTYGEQIAHRLRTGIPGRCVYQGLSIADGGDFCDGQIAYAPTADLQRFLTDLSGPTPEPTHHRGTTDVW